MRDLLAALAELRERLKEIPQADERRLQDLKTEVLGRKAGALTQLLATLPQLEPASRKAVGAAANALKREFETAIAARERDLKHAPDAAPGLDLTMPGREQWRGGLHLVTQVVDEICEIFRELGFTRAVGPEIETERYNFYALNFPRDHPALDAQ
ncbi:MAG TPA: phenylalanine--tRNA ligase subunit alpha, partial [Gemmatimonadales bacterium]|nr:phenylalanine--tRNA ligase subunit alpha [Gemmatimonadales bacterium]